MSIQRLEADLKPRLLQKTILICNQIIDYQGVNEIRVLINRNNYSSDEIYIRKDGGIFSFFPHPNSIEGWELLILSLQAHRDRLKDQQSKYETLKAELEKEGF